MVTHPVKVADVDDVAPGHGIVIAPELSGHPTPIALFHADDGAFYALDDSCPHVGASLARGPVRDTVIECPLHHGMWCLKTGAAVKYPARRPAVTHEVQVHDGEVWLHPGRPGVD